MATINIAGNYYNFAVTAANATVGATYTNNGVTYTVQKTITSGTILILTATALSVTSGVTLTKATGTGDATITFSAVSLSIPVNSLLYATGDTINVYGGQTFLVNETPTTTLGPLVANSITAGTLSFENTSTTTPVVVSLNTENSDITSTYITSLTKVRGEWIQIGTGNGLAGQTLDFNTVVGGVPIDWPSVIWIETGDVRHKLLTVGGVDGRYMPFFNCGAIADTAAINILQNFHGDLDHGPVFQYDTGTKVATFGKGGVVSKVLGGTNMSAGTHSGTTATITVGVGHGVVSGEVITVSGVTGAGATGYNGTWTVTSVTATTIVYTTVVSTAVAAIGGTIDLPLGGAVIPNGAKIVFPNIHFTSTIYNASPSSRNLLAHSAGASGDFDKCNFSRNWYLLNAWNGAGDVTMQNISCMSRVTPNANIGTITFDNFAVAPDSTLALTTTSNLAFSNNVGLVYVDYLWCLSKTISTYAPNIQFGSVVQFRKIGVVWGWMSSISNGGAFPIIFDSLANFAEAPLVCGPLYCVGGQLYILRVDNLHISSLTMSDSTTAVASTLRTGGLAILAYAKNTVLSTIRSFTNGVSPRGTLINIDTASSQVVIKDMIYTGANNAGTVLVGTGTRVYGANLYVTDPRASLATSPSIKNNRVCNFISNLLQTTTPAASGMYYEWTTGTTNNYINTVVYDTEPFQPVWTNASKTAGFLRVGSFSKDKNMVHTTVVSGTEGTDFFFNANAINYPGDNVELIFTNYWPVRGITNFTGGVLSAMGGITPTSSATIEFSLRVNDQTDTSVWSDWYDFGVGANWQTALASLTGYTSTKGFFPRFRIKTTAAVLGRYATTGAITCTPDSTWTPEEIGFIPISISGHVANSCVAMYDNTVPASPVLAKKKIITTTDSEILDLPYNFDATAKAYKTVLRKAGYGEAIISDSAYQKGKSAPFSQVLYKVIVDATAAAITGITVNGGTNTITLTANNSISDVYDYLQWWAAQVANMEYAIPLVTSDLSNFASTYNIVINTGVTLSGAGQITISGGATLTMTGTAQSALNITHTNGTRVWTRITVSGLIANSRLRIYNTTGSVELVNAVIAGTSYELQREWAGNIGLDFRVTYVVGLLAYTSFGAAGSFTETGAALTVSQELDVQYNANAIDGSTLSGITGNYTDQRLVFNSGTTYTVQQIYARYRFLVHHVTGIVQFYGGATMQDPVNMLINSATLPLVFNNLSGANILVTGGYIARADGASWVFPTSPNSFIPVYDRAYIANSTAIKNNTDLIPALL